MFGCLDSELTSGPHTGIPWKPGLRRGSALEADGDSILVGEEGFYFVYSQVGPLSIIPEWCHTRALSPRLSADRSSQRRTRMFWFRDLEEGRISEINVFENAIPTQTSINKKCLGHSSYI